MGNDTPGLLTRAIARAVRDAASVFGLPEEAHFGAQAEADAAALRALQTLVTAGLAMAEQADLDPVFAELVQQVRKLLR